MRQKTWAMKSLQRVPASGPIKFGMLMAGFIAAWYFGQLLADAIIDSSLSHGLTMIRKIGQKSQSGVPFPKQHKCGHWTACPSGSFSFLVLSGSKKEKPPKICFEGEILLGREKDNYGRGMNIAVVEDNSGAMIEFLKKAPDGSLIFMATFDDSSARLTEDAKKYIEGLGSKEIQKLAFRGNWVFVATKGFTLPKDYEREKVINSVKGNGAWASEIQILGCFSPKRDYL